MIAFLLKAVDKS